MSISPHEEQSTVTSQEPEKKAGRKPPKRAKTTKENDIAKPKASARRHLKQGRPGVLPTLPMDVLFEIFRHLGPADVLHLARTTKSLRGILMSRRSVFLWRAVLDAATTEFGYPPRPEDMNEPVWTNLVFGAGLCGICGSKTTKEVLWAMRRRLCRSCCEKRLIKEFYTDYPRGLMAPKIYWTEILHSDALRSEERWRNRIHNYVLKEDMEAYINELKALRDTGGDFISLRSQLDDKKKAEVEERAKHADACYKAASARSGTRARELGDLKKTRFEQIEARLLTLGYAAVDLENQKFGKHPEVKLTKPITDRTWVRLEPIMRKLVEDIRASRLNIESRWTEQTRGDVAEEEFHNTIVRALPWTLVPFVLDSRDIWMRTGFEDVKALVLLEGGVSKTKDWRSSIRQALISAIPSLQHSIILEQASKLKDTVPSSWTTIPRSPPPSWSHSFAHSASTLDLSALAPLDRAAFVFRCCKPRRYDWPRPVHFGLDVISHGCAREGGQLVPEDGLRSLVLQILDLLGLDPASATPLDIDRLNPVFICMNGHPSEFGVYGAGIAFANWRDAIAHGDEDLCQKGHEMERPVFRPACDLEARYVHAFAMQRFRASREIWGCCYCSEHLETRDMNIGGRFRYCGAMWKTIADMKTHLRDAHMAEQGVEGRDYYYNRCEPETRFEQKPYGDEQDTSSADLYNANLIHLPDINPGEFEALVLEKEAEIAAGILEEDAYFYDSDGEFNASRSEYDFGFF
ncbi:hypothetical protein PENSPDRAFT_602518 [Peniophora sp. CONT]|nr:hypothetical protein PENSPDRAFT_602518 [Peniophora sp. CONT]